MADQKNSGNVMTPRFRVSFPNVFRPGKVMEQGQTPKFNVTMLFPKGTDLTPLKNAVIECLTEQFGPDRTKWPKVRVPFRDQGEKTFEGYEAGATFINATSNNKPGLVDHNRVDILDEHEFYPGCYARATVRPFYYDKRGNKGVAFGLQNIQKLGDGEPLGGRSKPQDDFEAVPAEGGNGAAGSVDDIFG